MNDDMDPRPTTLGLPENVAGVLCYLLAWVSGLVILLVEKKSRFVRFHALQSLITFGILTSAAIVFGRVPLLGVIIGLGTGVVGLAAWVVGMMRAYQGQAYRFPIVGDIAQRQLPGE